MGSRLISKNATRLNGFKIANTSPTDGQILAYQSSSSSYVPSNASGGGSNISNTNLTQSDLDRTYTMPNLGKLAFGGTGSEFHLEDAIDFKMFNGSNDTASNARFSVFVGSNTSYLFFNNNRTSMTTVSDSLTLKGHATTIHTSQLVLGADIDIATSNTRSVIFKTANIFFKDITGATNYGHIDDDEFYWGGINPVGDEKFSIQVDTLVKGSDNAENTRGFKVIDINDDTLFDIRNNGQIGYGGAYLNTVGHKFRNPNSEAIIASFDDDMLGTESFSIQKGGRIYSENNGQTLFLSYRQSGQSYIKLYDAGVESVRFNKAYSFVNGPLRVCGASGTTTGTVGIAFEIAQRATNTYQQLFFANARVATLGRINSSGSYNTDQKGLECYDTDINKKYFWNGTAWEKIKGNIESVSVASASTITPNVDSSEMEIVSALAAALTIGAPTGTPHEGKELTFRIKDDGTARGLTWNAIFVDYTGALPTTTVANKTVYIGCKYNAVDTKWDVVAVQVQP